MRTTSVADAVAKIPDGASLMIGGFMGVGTPERIVDELIRQHKRDLTVIANDTALPGVGIAVKGEHRRHFHRRPARTEDVGPDDAADRMARGGARAAHDVH